MNQTESLVCYRAMISGSVSASGTLRYTERFPGLTSAQHFRRAAHVPGVSGLLLSSLGIGTYLGEPDSACDQLYVQSVEQALLRGINVVDTAINYRHQRSERNVGRAIASLIHEGRVNRDEFLVCTKAGYLAFDSEIPEDPRAYFKREYLDRHIFKASDLAGHMHCMAPNFIADQLRRSRENLGLETIDVFYLHNPESQLGDVKPDVFSARLLAAFEQLEKAVATGLIRWYGIASWNAFRTAPGQEQFISLEDCVKLAVRAGGAQHHFRFVQLPFNLAMTEAHTLHAQPVAHEMLSLLEAARRLEIAVIGSASLHQGHLVDGLPERLRSKMNACRDVECALQFARSAEGFATALVGMSHPSHVKDNLEVAKKPPVSDCQWRELFSR